MNPGAPAKPSLTPDHMISMVHANSKEKAHEQSLAVSGQFVDRLIEAGQIKDIKTAVKTFQDGVTEVKPFLEKQMLDVALAALAATFGEQK